MHKLVYHFLFFCCFTLCVQPLVFSQAPNNPLLFDARLVSENINFEFEVTLEEAEYAEHFCLIGTIDLAKDAYIISPFSKDSFYQNYVLTLPDNEYFEVVGNIVEFPASSEEVDPYIEQVVKYVRTKTSFTHELNIKKDVDFSVPGIIEFLVEPSCIPYDVKFVISNQAGKLEIKQLEIYISEEHKR